MRQEQTNIFSNIDWLLVFLYVILVAIGWINIYAATFTEEHYQIFDLSTKYGKQLLWIGLGFLIIIFILFFNSGFYERFAGFLYLGSVLSLIGLFIFGKNINGATSWYNFANGIGIQPSEFAKAFTALALAKLMSDRQYNLKLIKNQIKAFIIIFLPAVLITLQPDPGSALIYLSFFFVLNREGLTLNYILFGSLTIFLFFLTLYFEPKHIIITSFSILTVGVLYAFYKNKQLIRFNGLKIVALYAFIGIYILGVDYTYNNVFQQRHRDRFDILLGKKVDTKNIGYNTYQSELTIGSGGFSGKGFLQGDRTQGKFVPEQHTDYIFSTVGEEWGFWGSSIVIILFMCLLYRIIYLSEQQANKIARIYGYGVASVLFFHIAVNIGMVIGLLPTVGIPLPFFSYGGSSLWGFTILIFIFVRLDAHKRYDYW